MRTLLTILALLYGICPYDIIPDFLVGLGWLDDLIVFWLLWQFLYGSRSKGGWGWRYFRKGGNANCDSSAGSREGQSQSRSADSNGSSANDPYSVLGVSRGATDKEIRKAYIELASKYHPDKVMHLGEEFRDLAEERFKEIQSAYDKIKA